MINSMIVLALRLFFGILITAGAVGKVLDASGFVSVIETYRLGFSRRILWAIAVFVIAFELALGIIIRPVA